MGKIKISTQLEKIKNKKNNKFSLNFSGRGIISLINYGERKYLWSMIPKNKPNLCSEDNLRKILIIPSKL